MAAFLPDRLARLDALLHDAVARGEVPGLVALLARRGEVHVVVAGVRALGGPPMRRDSLFRIASVTKPVVAAAALALVEQGRVTLDAAVDRWLPELADRRVLRSPDGSLEETVPAARPITLRDLLTMRMGLGAAFTTEDAKLPIARAMAAAGLEPSAMPFAEGPEEFLRRLATLPLQHQPGERWIYHTSSEVLGLLVARIHGGTLGAALRALVLDPLGMADTAFHGPPGRLATAYVAREGQLEVFDPAEGGRFAAPPAFESGGGGLVSGADDLLAFARMLMGEVPGPLAARTRRAMMADQIPAAQKALSTCFPGFWEANGWGLGLGVNTRRAGPAESPGRFGWDGGTGTSLWCDPESGLAGVLLTQRLWDDRFTALRDGFWALAAAALAD